MKHWNPWNPPIKRKKPISFVSGLAIFGYISKEQNLFLSNFVFILFLDNIRLFCFWLGSCDGDLILSSTLGIVIVWRAMREMEEDAKERGKSHWVRESLSSKKKKNLNHYSYKKSYKSFKTHIVEVKNKHS